MDILINVVGTIAAAIIAAVALLRVNRIDNQDRIRRGLWAMEVYLYSAAGYTAVHTDENRGKYKGYYFVCLLYADGEMKIMMRKIDKMIEEEHWEEALSGLNELCWKYNEKYDMRRFRPKRRNKK